MKWVLLCLSLLPLTAFGQLQVYQFDGSNETLAGALLDVGTVTPGDTLESRFRVRNSGAGPATFQTLAVAGEGFKITAAPSLPYIIAPGAAADFRIAFSPSTTGMYSAFLQVNSTTIALRGNSVPAAALLLAGSKTPLIAGALIDFGSVTKGGSRSQGFTLLNSSSDRITVSALTVAGSAFRGPIGLASPVQLDPGQTASFQVAFEPQNGQPALGILTVDKRTFNLTGLGLDPPLPTASIVLNSTIGASARQNSLSIPLAAASPINGTATLTMEFRPSVSGVSDDAAIQFLSGPKRAATVTITAGDTFAKFGNQSSLAFQTGTTAGTIVFTLKLPTTSQSANLTIAPAAVNIDTAHAVRRVNDLDISLTGFDNTYSASQLNFTFFDLSGAAMAPGAISVDAASAFQHYFASTR